MVPTKSYGSRCVDSKPFRGWACWTDNSKFTVFAESSVNSSSWRYIKHALDVQFQPTDLTVIYASTPIYSGAEETDEIYQIRSDVPASSDGYTWCDDAVSSFRCDQSYGAFKAQVTNDGLVCHETGHAVGLLHGADASPALSQTDPSLGCMQTPVGPMVGLGANNISEINNVY